MTSKSNAFDIPKTMKAWVLGGPEQLSLVDKPVPEPGRGFAQYAVNSVNTMVHVPDEMSDEEATLIVAAGTAMYGLDVMGGIIAGEPVVVIGPGPIGLMGVGVAKALGAQPVILTGTR